MAPAVGAAGCSSYARAAQGWVALVGPRTWGAGEDWCPDPHAQFPWCHCLHLCEFQPAVTQQSAGGSKGIAQGHGQRGKPGQMNTHRHGGSAREVAQAGLPGLKVAFVDMRS